MNWMTVKEVAKYLKLSEVMVYKLAQGGGIPASKIGSAWRFSQDEIDRWLVRGTKTSADVVGAAGEALGDFIRMVREEYQDDFATAILFGSYARGEADEGSDIDVLVVLKEIDDPSAALEHVGDIAYASTFDKGRPYVIVPIVMREADFLAGSSPLLINIRKEGVKAA